MKSIISFFTALFLSVSVFAANEPTTSNNYQTLDLKQFDNLKDQSKVKVKVGMSCKSDSGLEYKAGDMGYEQCVKSTSKNSDQKDGSKSQNNGNMEITF